MIDEKCPFCMRVKKYRQSSRTEFKSRTAFHTYHRITTWQQIINTYNSYISSILWFLLKNIYINNWYCYCPSNDKAIYLRRTSPFTAVEFNREKSPSFFQWLSLTIDTFHNNIVFSVTRDILIFCHFMLEISILVNILTI